MIRVFQPIFHRALALGFTPLALAASVTLLRAAEVDWEARTKALQSELTRCGQNEAACVPASHRTWLTLRWSGQTLLLSRRGPESATTVEGDSQRELIQRLARSAVVAPAGPGVYRSWTLSVGSGWSRLRVGLEKSLSADSSVLLVTELPAEWGTSPTSESASSTSRDWVFSETGDTLYQSEGLFIGSNFLGNSHFHQSQSKTSFDQREVRASWKNAGPFGWRILREELQPEAQPLFAERVWKWFSEWGLWVIQGFFALALITLMGLFGMAFRAIVRKWPLKKVQLASEDAQESHQENQVTQTRPVQVQVPRVVEAQRELQRDVTSLHQNWNWNESILRARSFLELGKRLMVSIAERTNSPVLFLEFHREASLALFRDQVGLRPEEAPLSLRIPLSDIPSHLADQPAFQSFILSRLGVSYFEVYELRAQSADSIRSQLLAVFVILQPGVSSFEARSDLEKLLIQAGKYYDAFLRPRPPQIRP